MQARCQIATQPRAAAGAVRRLSVQAAGLPPGLWRDPLVARLFALAELLARPDLVAGLHAATVADAPTPAEAAAAAARWEAWASARLGAVDGIPTADLTGAATAEPPLEPPAPST